MSVVIEEKEEAREQPVKGAGKRKGIREKIRLGAKSEMPSLSWLCHLRQMVKEADAERLKDVEVIRGFNALVDLMTENVQHVWSNLPHGVDKYRKSFALEEDGKDPIGGICTIAWLAVYRPATGDRWYYRSRFGRSDWERAQEITLRNQIIDRYRPLWEQVRDAVEPYMARKVREFDGRNRQKRLESLIMMLEAEEIHYQREKNRLEAAIVHLEKSHQERVTRRRAEIAKLSSEAAADSEEA